MSSKLVCPALKATLLLVVVIVVMMTDNQVLSAPANTPAEEQEISQAQLPIQQKDDSTAIKNPENVPFEPVLPPGVTPSLEEIRQYQIRPDSLDLTGQNKKSQEVLNFTLDEENSPDLQLTQDSK